MSATVYRQALDHAVLFDISERGKIELAGPEAIMFLQNICTNDIVKAATNPIEAFLTTNKAKVIAYVQVYKEFPGLDAKSLWLTCDPGLNATVLGHLDHHIISEQVELTDRTTEFAQMHLAGLKAPMVIEKAVNGASPTDPVVQRHDYLGIPGYDLFCPIGSLPSVREGFLSAGATLGDPETYEILRMEAGIPRHGAEIEDERFVVELNRPQAICYTKGCYLGQEPIVMARDRGHVNRKLMGLKLTAPLAFSRGLKVFRDATEVGQVTSCVVSPRFGPIALAYLRRGNEAPGTSVEIEADGQRRGAEVVSLPFKMPST